MPHRSIETQIEIDAPPDQVWEVFGDFERYPDWNPFVRRLDGQVEVGQKLTIRLEPPEGRAVTFKPKVLVFQPGIELRWLGNLLMPGIFDGEHSFRLEPIDDSRTRFVQREEFRGVLVRPLLRSVGEQTRHGFEAMNQALKERVEAGRG